MTTDSLFDMEQTVDAPLTARDKGKAAEASAMNCHQNEKCSKAISEFYASAGQEAVPVISAGRDFLRQKPSPGRSVAAFVPD